MESQKPKIAMYVKRNFGEKLSASFDFIKENWKLMLKFTTYLLLPICLIQALSLNGLMGYIAVLTDLSGGGGLSDASLMMSFFSYYSLYMFVFLIGTIALTSLIYALIRTYNERDERLQGVTLGMLRPMLLRNVKKIGCDDSFRIALNGTFRGDYGIHGGIALARPVLGDSVCDYFGCTICSLGTDLSL